MHGHTGAVDPSRRPLCGLLRVTVMKFVRALPNISHERGSVGFAADLGYRPKTGQRTPKIRRETP
jgi:hypothetical protein